MGSLGVRGDQVFAHSASLAVPRLLQWASISLSAQKITPRRTKSTQLHVCGYPRSFFCLTEYDILDNFAPSYGVNPRSNHGHARGCVTPPSTGSSSLVGESFTVSIRPRSPTLLDMTRQRPYTPTRDACSRFCTPNSSRNTIDAPRGRHIGPAGSDCRWQIALFVISQTSLKAFLLRAS